MDVGPRRGGAVLAAVDERAGRRAARRRLEVGVGVDDERRLAAELEVDALEVAGRERLDPLAGLRVAGERDEVDVHVRRERRTDDVAPPGDDVEDAGRDTRPRAASSASRIVVSGVALAGLSTIEFPAARAGPIFQIAIQIG